ncbi:Sec63 Brl domain-containing protein [Macrophomina phaseolina]|uniref:Sec63 Brl domain-containing protein n=1 Tax=Macrophomina phaseolina TaxID=35725 RepID=A0ABQ8G5F5_9PEZI|nr:Sec63 Brl domain-containing protein [Macrophomina phaseolina]
MSTDYNYDEQGQFFPYFVITITGLVTIPVTISLLTRSKDLENTAPRIQSDFTPEHVDLIDGQRKKLRRQERKLGKFLLALGGWVVMAWMAYLMVVTARTVPKIWDPYDVLGVSRSATEKEIKSFYRKLSITNHPDKVQPDPSKNLTMEDINEKWVEYTKAFKALTDEEVRNNYLQYGHPDGKQSFSIGIALPKWIVTEGHGRYVLLGYGIVLGVFLPYLVGKWWYGTQRVTKEKVLVSSAGNIFKEYKPDLSEGGVLSALSTGTEFEEAFKGHKAEAGLSKIESKLFQEGELSALAGGLSAKDRQTLEELDEGPRRKALALLWAYLGRVELDDQTLNAEKFEVAPIAHKLNDAFFAVALAYGNTQPLLASYHTSQNILQAIPPQSSPLLQLPGFTPAVVRAVEGESARVRMTVLEYLSLPAEERRKRAVGPGLLSESEYANAEKVARQLPHLHVEKAFFKVLGEKVIIPSSLVQFVVKARIIPPGSTNVPPVNERDLEDVDPKEGDLDALHGRKKGVEAEEAKKAETAGQPPLAYAPYFPRDHSPRWHVFLSDTRQGKVAVPPFTFTKFDKPLFDEQGNPTYNVQTLKMQFGAPPQPGQYKFTMNLVCDSYVGMDTKMDVVLNIDHPSKAAEIEEEEDISEPEEDTIAGQMAAMKGGETKKPKARKVEESSGSDTEGDEDLSDTSETDTDTDTDEE